MHVVSHPEAEKELQAAAQWYDDRQAGLGDSFLEQFGKALRKIVLAPERPSLFRGENRKLNMDRFPYGIVYTTRGGTLYITAVMHLHRRPTYWSRRAF